MLKQKSSETRLHHSLKTLFESQVFVKNDRDSFSLSMDLNKIFNCFKNSHSAKFLYILSVKKISTTHEMKGLVGLSSRDTIAYHSAKAQNSRLTHTILPSHKYYHVYRDYWKDSHPTTNKNCAFLVPSTLLCEIIPFYESHLTKLIDSNQYESLERLGSYFKNYFSKRITKIKNGEEKDEFVSMTTIGSCVKCSRLLTKHHETNKSCKYFLGKLYCKDCYEGMSAAGELSELYRAANAENNM